MAEDNMSIQVLLIEGPNVNDGVSSFIEEEIVCSIPDDIEVIQVNNLPEVNFNKPLPPDKPFPPKKQAPPKAKRKRRIADSADARANKIQPLITLPEPPKDSFIDFCGLKVPVKTLLQNSDIRKQLAPFIEEVVVSDISDTSDVEEIDKFQRKKVPAIKERKKLTKSRSKKRKRSPEATVKEGTGPFVEVLIPDLPDSTDVLGRDIIVNLPLAIEKDAIEDTREMYVLEEQIQLVTDSSDNEPVVERNRGILNKQTLSRVNNIDRSKNNNAVYKKSKHAAKNIADSEVVILDEELEENYECKDTNNIQEACVMESDDWYYLNMANRSKVNDNTDMATSKVDDNDESAMANISKENDEKIENGLVVEKDVESDDQGSPNQESKVEIAKPKRRKKRRRVPWSRHAIRGTRVSKNVKTKLQGGVVKGSVKNVTDIQGTTSQSYVIHNKAENAGPSSIQEKTNNPPKTSILDQTNINHNGHPDEGPLPVVKQVGGTTLTAEPNFDIKQEPVLENNEDETAMEVSKVNKSNKEIDENKLRIKLEQEVSWNTDVNYQNSYIQKNLNKQQSANPQQVQRNMTARQKQSKLSAKRMFFGQRRILGKCDNCGKKYERLGALRRHQLMCKVNYECAMCSFSTSDKFAFRQHLANHILGTVDVRHEEKQTNAPANTNLMVYCSICSEDSTAVEGLNKCQKCLGYLEYYRCKICEKLFEDYPSLRKHILISLQGAQAAQLQKDTDRCSRCGANGFSTKCEFRSHLVNKCGPKKIMKIPYVRLERCKIPQKLTKETQYWAKSYCPKCLIMRTASKIWTDCNKCKSKLSFICEICRSLSITYADLRTHMFCAHKLDLHDFVEKFEISEQKCLSIDQEKSSSKNKSCPENEHTIKDLIASTEETNKANNLLRNNKSSLVSVIKPITGFDKKINQRQKEIPEIKIDSPIKLISRKSTAIEKQVSGVDTSQESNSDKYFNQYSMKVVNSEMVDKTTVNKRKSLNRKIKSSVMQMQKQYFKRDNGAFGKELKKACFKLSKKTKFGLTNKIKRFCIKCDKTKEYYETIKMGLTIEICRKCKMQLLYQCKNCHGICKDYEKMTWHVIYRCNPRLRFFSVSHKSHLRKILERRYALLEAQQNIFDSIALHS